MRLNASGHTMKFLGCIWCVVLTGVRTHVVATAVCATGCAHTLTCCTHIFSGVHTLRVHFAHSYACCAHMHGSRVSAVRMSSCLSHVPPVLAPLRFLDGHFETTPDNDLDDLTDVPVHAILPNFPDLEAQVKRTPHEDEEFGFLAKSALNTEREWMN